MEIKDPFEALMDRIFKGKRDTAGNGPKIPINLLEFHHLMGVFHLLEEQGKGKMSLAFNPDAYVYMTKRGPVINGVSVASRFPVTKEKKMKKTSKKVAPKTATKKKGGKRC